MKDPHSIYIIAKIPLTISGDRLNCASDCVIRYVLIRPYTYWDTHCFIL